MTVGIRRPRKQRDAAEDFRLEVAWHVDSHRYANMSDNGMARLAARLHAEHVALGGIIKFLVEALPPEQKAKFQKMMRNVIANKMGELPVPDGVPPGQEQAYRDRFSQIAQMMIES